MLQVNLERLMAARRIGAREAAWDLFSGGFEAAMAAAGAKPVWGQYPPPDVGGSTEAAVGGQSKALADGVDAQDAKAGKEAIFIKALRDAQQLAN